MRSGVLPGSPHGSELHAAESEHNVRTVVPYPTRELLRQDRENRDFVYNLGFAVSVLEDMLVKFETTTRAKLSELNNKAARLERLLTYAEFVVSGGAPADAELPYPTPPASPVASVHLQLSANNSPRVGVAAGTNLPRRALSEGRDVSPRRDASEQRSGLSPSHPKATVVRGKEGPRMERDGHKKSPARSSHHRGRVSSPTSSKRSEHRDDGHAHSSSHHSSICDSRRGETDDLEDVGVDQHKVGKRSSPGQVRESYTVNSSFQDWRPPGEAAVDAEQMVLRSSRKDELVDMNSDDEQSSEVNQVVNASPTLVHQWHRTMDNVLYESLAFPANSLQASTPSDGDWGGTSREITPQSAMYTAPGSALSAKNSDESLSTNTRGGVPADVGPRKLFVEDNQVLPSSSVPAANKTSPLQDMSAAGPSMASHWQEGQASASASGSSREVSMHTSPEVPHATRQSLASEIEENPDGNDDYESHHVQHSVHWKPELQQVVEEPFESGVLDGSAGKYADGHAPLRQPIPYEYHKPPIPKPAGAPHLSRRHPGQASGHVHLSGQGESTDMGSTVANHHHEYDASSLPSQSSPIDPESRSLPDVDGGSLCHTPTVLYQHSIHRHSDEEVSDYGDLMLPLPHFLDSSPPPPSRASSVGASTILDQAAAEASGTGLQGARPAGGWLAHRTSESYQSGSAGSASAASLVVDQFLDDHMQRFIEHHEYAPVIPKADDFWGEAESLSSPAPRVRTPLTASQGG